MADDTPATPAATNPAGTDGDEPAATQQPAAPGATKDDETVTIPKKDLDNLVSARDRANNSARETEAWVNEQRVRQAIGTFLGDNKEKYPDVEVDDLLDAEGPEHLDSLAEKMQLRISKAAQTKLQQLESASPPQLSAKERRQKLADLKKNTDDPKRFDKMLELQGVDNI